MTDTQLSRATYQRLKSELEDLTTRGRIDVATRIEAARALGDLSENGDYHAAKDDQGKMEARVRQLEAILKTAVIVDDSVASSEQVTTGSIVSLRYEGDEDVERYLVGSIEERQAGLAVVSPNSPLGQALLGHSAGDVVDYEAPSGRMRVAVVKVGD